MSQTRSIQELPLRGTASTRPLEDGSIRVHATHAIALLRLIELEGGLDIRVTEGEWEELRAWPLWPLQVVLEDGSSEQWARVAVDLLRAGPPPAARRAHLALLAVAVFAVTWGLLHLMVDRIH